MGKFIVWNKERLEQLLSEGYTCYTSLPIGEFYRLLVRAGLCSSTSEARRLIKCGAVTIDGRKLPPDAKLFLVEKKGN